MPRINLAEAVGPAKEAALARTEIRPKVEQAELAGQIPTSATPVRSAIPQMDKMTLPQGQLAVQPLAEPQEVLLVVEVQPMVPANPVEQALPHLLQMHKTDLPVLLDKDSPERAETPSRSPL